MARITTVEKLYRVVDLTEPESYPKHIWTTNQTKGIIAFFKTLRKSEYSQNNPGVPIMGVRCDTTARVFTATNLSSVSNLEYALVKIIESEE